MSKTLHSDIPPKIDMDDGYFPLARTAILTLSKTRLSGSQRGIIDVIFTQTYGYHCDASPHRQRAKKRHTRAQISHEYFMTATWMGKQEVSRAINALIKWRIIARDKNTSPYTYWFNVQVDHWAPDCWRVSRIANHKQNSEQSAVPRPISSSQDSEPLANQLTKSSQDSEPGVSRTANCSQVPSLEPQGVPGTLNKYINKINKNNDDDNSGGSKLAALFTNELGRPLSGYEINQLEQWSKQTSDELLVEALKKSTQHGKFSFAYIQGILKDWQKNNVKTLADVQRHDAEFKNKKGGVIRGPTATTKQPGNAGGYSAGDKDAGFTRPPGPPNKYDGIDFSKFYFQG